LLSLLIGVVLTAIGFIIGAVFLKAEKRDAWNVLKNPEFIAQFLLWLSAGALCS
jgi:hypothetical protein